MQVCIWYVEIVEVMNTVHIHNLKVRIATKLSEKLLSSMSLNLRSLD